MLIKMNANLSLSTPCYTALLWFTQISEIHCACCMRAPEILMYSKNYKKKIISDLNYTMS